jgi:hypothetical protein
MLLTRLGVENFGWKDSERAPLLGVLIPLRCALGSWLCVPVDVKIDVSWDHAWKLTVEYCPISTAARVCRVIPMLKVLGSAECPGATASADPWIPLTVSWQVNLRGGPLYLYVAGDDGGYIELKLIPTLVRSTHL